MDTIEKVAALVRLNDGQIVGKTRFQKIAYLLDAKGLGLDVPFDYHNYGPFSAELAIAVDDAIELRWLESEERLGSYSVPYTIYKKTDITPRFVGDSDQLRRRQDALQAMAKHGALVLELAATAEYLRKNGFPDTAWEEVEKRKPLKANPSRTAEAKKLLQELGLPV